MAKKYNSSWYAKKLIVDFNQKQWRQDFASFVKEKKLWDIVKVTRAKSVSNKPSERGIKCFEIFNNYGGNIIVTFLDNNKIIKSTDDEIMKEYLSAKGIITE